jgi:hypothetical protein
MRIRDGDRSRKAGVREKRFLGGKCLVKNFTNNLPEALAIAFIPSPTLRPLARSVLCSPRSLRTSLLLSEGVTPLCRSGHS